MAVALSPPAPPTSLKRVNSDGTPTQAQLDYERAIAKWVADQINALGGGAIPLPTPTTLGGVKSLAAVSHKFLTSIGTDGLPVAAQPSAGDISGLSPFATATSIAVGSITGLGALATLSSVDLGSQVTGNLGVSHFNSGIDASSSKFWRGDGIWAPVTASAGGSSGQIQFNSAGSLGGFTVAGDGTLDPVTGSLIVTKTNGVSFAAVATGGSAADLSNGTVGTGAVALAANPSFTGTAVFQTISASTLGATTATLVTAHTTTFDATTATIATAIIGTGTITNLTVDVPAGGTSTGTIGTFKDVDGTNTRLLVDSVGAVPVIDFRQARGTSAAPSASQTDDILGILAARGYGATGYNLTAASGAISFRAAENWTNTAQGSYFTFETTPTGSTARSTRARIGADGRFGIGRTATTYILEAQGDIFATGSFRGDGSLLTGIASGQVSGLAAVATSGSASDLGSGTLPAARLPNPSATTLGGVQSKAAVASNWLTSISTSGVPAASQPAFTDISGTPSANQIAGQFNGSVNKFCNGTMDIWQGGTGSVTVTTAGAYVADGWIVTPIGASCTAAQSTGRLLTVNSLQVTGATSVTDITIKQRIESNVAAPLTSQTVTVQAQVFNNTGGSITPTLTVKHATAADNWAATATDVSAVNLQACANSAWTQVAYTFAASASTANGLEVTFDFGNNFSTTGKSVKLSEVDIRISPGVATGLNSSAPAPELRPYPIEMTFSQRYYLVGPTIQINTVTVNGSVYTIQVFFPVPMRTTPTVTQTNAGGQVGFAAGTNQTNVSNLGFLSYRVSNAGNNSAVYGETFTANARL